MPQTVTSIEPWRPSRRRRRAACRSSVRLVGEHGAPASQRRSTAAPPSVKTRATWPRSESAQRAHKFAARSRDRGALERAPRDACRSRAARWPNGSLAAALEQADASAQLGRGRRRTREHGIGSGIEGRRHLRARNADDEHAGPGMAADDADAGEVGDGGHHDGRCERLVPRAPARSDAEQLGGMRTALHPGSTARPEPRTHAQGSSSLSWGDPETVSCDQRERVAVPRGWLSQHPGSRATGRRAFSREPARLARAVAAAIVLDPPAGHRDRAEARSVLRHGVEHRLAQAAVQHDRTRFDAPQLDRQRRDRYLAVATKARHGRTRQRADRLVGLERPDDVAGTEAARRATPAAGLAVPAQLAGVSASRAGK